LTRSLDAAFIEKIPKRSYKIEALRSSLSNQLSNLIQDNQTFLTSIDIWLIYVEYILISVTIDKLNLNAVSRNKITIV